MAYPASPSYGVSIGATRPGGLGTATAQNRPAAGAKAYDPAKAAGADAKNSDSSDSDDK